MSFWENIFFNIEIIFKISLVIRLLFKNVIFSKIK